MMTDVKENVPLAETCKALKENGWDADSTHFCWIINGEYGLKNKVGNLVTDWSDVQNYRDFDDRLPAPMLTEIIKKLPKIIGEGSALLQSSFSHTKHWWYFYSSPKGHLQHLVMHENPSEAAAQLWLSLKKLKLIK